MADLTALHEERRGLLASTQRIIDRCEAAGGRPMTADERQEFDRTHVQIEALGRRLQAARHDAAGRSDIPSAVELDGGGVQVGTIRGRPVVLPDGHEATGRTSPGYAALFRSYLAGNRGVAAAMQTDVSDTGGYLAPPQFVAELVKDLDNGFWFRSLARVLPPTNAPKVARPRRTARNATVAWGAELTAPSPDVGFRVGSLTLTPHWLTGELEISHTLTQADQVVSIVSEELRVASAELEEAAFLNGDGAGKPLGLFTPSAQGIDATRDVTADPTTYDGWLKLKFALRSAYLRSKTLRAVMHPNAYKLALSLKSSTGQPLIELADRAGDPDSLGGAAVELSDYAPTGTGASGAYQAGDYVACLGDVSRYAIQDGIDLRIARLPDSGYIRRGMIGFIYRRKVDGGIWDKDGFARLKVA